MTTAIDGDTLLQIVLALVCGGIMGLERELANKPAGLRTHMLVCASAALIVGIGPHLLDSFTPDANVQSDPLRLIEAVVVGVSVLGAGTILQRQDGTSVEGLTTAASLLMAATVGIVVALGQWPTALVIVGLVLLATWGLGHLKRRVHPD